MSVHDKQLEVVPYDPGWPAAFEAEAIRLRTALGTLALRIDHNGSTSIPGLGAKPIIDIQVSVAALEPIAALSQGYPRESCQAGELSNNKALHPVGRAEREWPG